MFSQEVERTGDAAPHDKGWLLVGLGNPGEGYKRTRHNLGFMLVDMLAADLGTRIRRTECRSLIGRASIDNSMIELAKPQTYMNLSGEAVKCLVDKESRSLDKTLVIVDDLALPLGVIRLRKKGSSGGHNGLKSIISCLKSEEFPRLRIGIQPDHPLSNPKKFVLENFSRGELKTVEEVLKKGAEASRTMILDGIERAMSEYN